MRTLTLAFTLALVAVAAPAAAGEHDVAIAPGKDVRVWLPDDGTVVYGLYVILNESTGDTRGLITEERRQAWAQSFGFGLVGTRIDSVAAVPCPGDAGSSCTTSDLVLAAIDQVAGTSGHPELANAPVLTEGLSMGGYMAYEFADRHPARTIGVLSGASGLLPQCFTDPASLKTPQLYYLGENDNPGVGGYLGRRTDLLELRAGNNGCAGLPGAQVAFWGQWGAGHERGDALEFGFKYLADLVKLRYPEGASPADGPIALFDIPDDAGWLAAPQTWDASLPTVMPSADWVGDPVDGFWLPTRDAAFVYRGHATQDPGVVFTTPALAVNQYDPRLVDPGDVVPLAVAVTLADVVSVKLYDGSVELGEDTTAPYAFTWTADGIGAHALVAVATAAGGAQATGLSAAYVVRGKEAPGGGVVDPSMTPDAGPLTGDGDAGPGGSGDGDGDGGGGCGGCSSGGTAGGDGGCRVPGGSQPAAGTLLIVALVALALRRRSSSAR